MTITNQILVDGPRNTVIKVIGDNVTLPLAVTTLITLSTLTAINPGMSGSLPPTRVRVDRIEYSISDGCVVVLAWNATTDVTLAELYGRGKVDAKHYGGIQNNAGAGVTGNIDISAFGYGEATILTTAAFTLTISLVKCLPLN